MLYREIIAVCSKIHTKLLSIVSTVSTVLLCLLPTVSIVSVTLYISNLQLQTFTPNLPAVMNSCPLPLKIVADGRTDRQLYFSPSASYCVRSTVAAVQDGARSASSVMYQQDKAVPRYSYLYCNEPVLWVSRKGNEPATNATSSRYYFRLLRDVVKRLRTLTVANGNRKWMLHRNDTSICQLRRWWLISMSVCSILVLYLHCAHGKSIPSPTASCFKRLP
jgi:hypothetical protein